MAKRSKKDLNRNRPNRERAVRELSDQRRKKILNRRMIIGIVLVLVIFGVFMGTKIVPLVNQRIKLKNQEAQLQREYKRELQLYKDLKKNKKYVQTDEYVEEMARKLGLLYPDEVILQPDK